MSESIKFSIPGRAPTATNPNSRTSWHAKHGEGRAYGDTVMLIASSTPVSYGETAAEAYWIPLERAHVTLTQHAVRLRDHDNFAASFKPGLDAIVRAGIIADDNPACIDLSLRAVKCKPSEERVVVEITRIEEDV